MLKKQFGLYALLLSILEIGLFIYDLLTGDRPYLFIIFDLAICVMVVAIIGLILDKRRVFSIVALLISVIPLAMMYALRFLTSN